MKKIIYSILFAAATLLTATSCSDDDDSNDNCLVCENVGTACDNGDGTVTIDDEDGVNIVSLEEIGFESFDELIADGCPDDVEEGDDEEEEVVATGQCVVCEATEFQGNAVPESSACELSNGNAEINGIDSGISFEEFISTNEFFTTCTIQ